MMLLGKGSPVKGLMTGFPPQLLIHDLVQIPRADLRRGENITPYGRFLVLQTGLIEEVKEGLVPAIIDPGNMDGAGHLVVPLAIRL